MKIIAIGDIHGRDNWRKIVELEQDSDVIIFLGDYVDSFDVDPLKQLHNLRDIIEFAVKSTHLEVVLLIGNHDYHYMDNLIYYERYSGFQPRMAPSFAYEYREYSSLFRLAYKDEWNNIYTHAGITKTWLDKVQIGSTDPKAVVDSINSLFKNKPNLFAFNQLDSSGYGNSVLQSPIWVRPESLYKDAFPNFQIVGHTEVAEPPNMTTALRKGFTVIDCLERGYYLTNINGNFTIKKLE